MGEANVVPTVRYRMLVLATATYIVCFATWTLVGALAPLYRQMLSLSATQVGWLVAAPVLVGALARLPVGILADRFGAHRVLSVLVAVLIVPALMAGWSTAYTSLLGSGALLGLAGAAFAAGVQFVSRWFPPERHGVALGVFGLGNLGAALSAALAPAASTAWGLHAVFALYAVVLGVTALMFFRFGRPPADPHAAGSGTLRALKVRGAWLLGFYFLVTFGGFLALSVHLAVVLVDVYGLSPESAGRHVGVFAVAGTFARPLGGYVADRLGGARVLYGVFPTVTALALALAAAPAHFVGTSVIFALGVTLGAGNGAVTKLIAERFPDNVGAVSGLAGGIGSLGGLLLPVVQGLGQDLLGSYVFGFRVLAALALISLILHARPFLAHHRGTPA